MERVRSTWEGRLRILDLLTVVVSRQFDQLRRCLHIRAWFMLALFLVVFLLGTGPGLAQTTPQLWLPGHAPDVVIAVESSESPELEETTELVAASVSSVDEILSLIHI